MLLLHSETKPQADASKAVTEDTASFHNHDHDPTQTAQACNEACMSYQCTGWWCKGHHHQRTPHHPRGLAPPQHPPSSSAALHAALAPCTLPCFAYRLAATSCMQALQKAAILFPAICLVLHTGGQFPHQARKDCERQSRPRGHCVRDLQQHVGSCGIAVVKLQVSSMYAVTKQSFCAKLLRKASAQSW